MNATAPKIILDTDLGGDIDDLGALALLHALADQGRCDILGMISDTAQPDAIGAIDAVNRWFGRGQLSIGRSTKLKQQDTYASAVVHAAPDDVLDGHDAPPALDIYRRLLADAPDRSVTIATIGVLLLLNDLLDSGPDHHSRLTGRELVDAKVDRFVMMGGNYPSNPTLPETNFRAWNNLGVSRRCIERITEVDRPITFIGGELGDRFNGYGTGARLNELPDNHPVRVGYLDFFTRVPDWVPDDDKPWDTIQPWSIWDQITLHHAACRNTQLLEEVPGLNTLDDTGINHFTPDPNGPHAYLKPRVSPAELAHDIIEPLMLTRPQPAAIAVTHTRLLPVGRGEKSAAYNPSR
ncbi:MAG: hypothetical protein AAF797_02905 [Planctomycetota bacterium]